MVLVYAKVSAYYPIYATMKAELTMGILVLIMLALRGDLFKAISIGNNRYNGYLAAFIGCVVLSYFMAWDRQFAWDNAVYHFIKVLVLYGVCVGSLSTQDDLKVFVLGFLLMFVYLAYEPIYGVFTGTSGQEHMYGTNYISDLGILSGHVALANNMNQMIPIGYYLTIQNKNRIIRILGVVSLFVFGVALIGSG